MHPDTMSAEPMMNMSFDTGSTFGSEATNMEYSMLSEILGNASEDQAASPTYAFPPQSRPSVSRQPSGYPPNRSEPWTAGQPLQPTSATLAQARQGSYNRTPADLSILPSDVNSQQQTIDQFSYLAGPSFPPRPPSATSFLRSSSQASFPSGIQDNIPPPEQPDRQISHALPSTQRPGEVYQTVTRPYDYTQVIFAHLAITRSRADCSLRRAWLLI